MCSRGDLRVAFVGQPEAERGIYAEVPSDRDFGHLYEAREVCTLLFGFDIANRFNTEV
jgi:hypothetical protein